MTDTEAIESLYSHMIKHSDTLLKLTNEVACLKKELAELKGGVNNEQEQTSESEPLPKASE